MQQPRTPATSRTALRAVPPPARSAGMAPPAEAPLYYSVKETARLLGLSERKAWMMVESGEIRSVKFAGRRLIHRSEIGRIEDLAGDGSVTDASTCAP